jgi:nitroreductase
MNEIIKSINNLKTTRRGNFSEEKISAGNFEAILKSWVHAPNASNRQSYSILIPDENEKKELNLHGDKVLLFFVDFYRHECLIEYVGSKISFNHFQPFLTAVIDVSLAVQRAVIAANSLKIGYLVTNDTYTKDLGRITDLFNLPKKGCFPLLYLCHGYPTEKKVDQKARIDLKHIVHYGKYRSYSKNETGTMVREYDKGEMQLFK